MIRETDKTRRCPAALNATGLMAAATIDVEPDYGSRTGNFNILRHKAELSEIISYFSAEGIPVSAFVTTGLLDEYPESLPLIQKLASDYHCHSHTHDTTQTDRTAEITMCRETFIKHFGREPAGYRAPQGVISDDDVRILKDKGFKFSSSVFPSLRPGKYNNLMRPCEPYFYGNGLMEIPFAAVKSVRYVVSLSYLKLIGMTAAKAMFKLFGLPRVVVIDSHLHDYITDADSFAALPPAIRVLYGIRKNQGLKTMKQLVVFLRGQGYEFVTMSRICRTLIAADKG